MILSNDFRLEFRKGAVALLPGAGAKETGVAFKVFPHGGKISYDTCTCRDRKQAHCSHRAALDKQVKTLAEQGIPDPYEALRQSIWDKLASVLNDAWKIPCDGVQVQNILVQPGRAMVRVSYKDRLLAEYSAHPDRADILLGRLGQSDTKQGALRHKTLTQLETMTLSDTERVMRKKGMMTRRQALENSIWYRLCYHLFFDWRFGNPDLEGRIDDKTGHVLIECASSDARMSFVVPGTSLNHVLMSLSGDVDHGGAFTVSETPLSSILKMSLNPQGDLDLDLYLRYGDPKNGEGLYRRGDMALFTYGDLVYLADRRCFAKIESPDLLIKKFKGELSRTVPGEKIPEHLDSLGDALWGRENEHMVDRALKDLKIYKVHDSVLARETKRDQSWFYLDVAYGFGESAVSIASLLEAKQEGRRFLPVEKGWVDVRAVDTNRLFSIPGMTRKKGDTDPSSPMALSVPDLFRFMAAAGKPVTIKENENGDIDRLLAMKPFEPVREIQGLESRLRDYQLHGVNWLLFLKEQGMSGILCDDMGLGKTHQVMALMAHMKFVLGETQPFLVVAPVTVLSHWENKLSAHVPGLRVATHYGAARDYKIIAKSDVVLTSYGLLRRNDLKPIKTGFSLAVFDEAQHLKNEQTQGYKAAMALRAAMKLCVTGTPVENSITELKALMDLSFPGYLGTDEAFESRYVKPVMQDNNKERREELSRLVTPFTLRRMKSTVLDELPEKIEDIMACRLSEDQITLYRQTVADKGSEIRRMLDTGDKIPYIHIFAMLTLLKQICDHPALALKKPGSYRDYQSGKWDLFREILSEALSSGQKIVIYSQYVEMIRIIMDELENQGVQAVSLTGQSKNRGELIRRFNDDPDCRVFVGSLLAGGTGIDLVSASVVIHYDRWWNAAKEDQATDRVHRIGQTRGVQVFKLMTLGTLEEKISAIIDRKKDLMDAVVKEDDPNLLKSFSRDQLLDLLAMPV